MCSGMVVFFRNILKSHLALLMFGVCHHERARSEFGLAPPVQLLFPGDRPRHRRKTVESYLHACNVLLLDSILHIRNGLIKS